MSPPLSRKDGTLCCQHTQAPSALVIRLSHLISHLPTAGPPSELPTLTETLCGGGRDV